MSYLRQNTLALVLTIGLVLTHCKLNVAQTSNLAARGQESASAKPPALSPVRSQEAPFTVADIENWVLNSTAETLDELMKEGPQLDAGNVGRAIGPEGRTPTTPPAKERGGRAGRDSAPKRRPDYFLTVTVPWTVGMLSFLLLFLYAMRTDGCVYRRLTHSYTPPAARQQLAEEARRERLEETERTATTAWESERARWRSQRSPRPDASADMVSSSSSGPAPSVSWAQDPADQRPAAQRSRARGQGQGRAAR